MNKTNFSLCLFSHRTSMSLNHRNEFVSNRNESKDMEIRLRSMSDRQLKTSNAVYFIRTKSNFLLNIKRKRFHPCVVLLQELHHLIIFFKNILSHKRRIRVKHFLLEISTFVSSNFLIALEKKENRKNE